MCTTGDEDCIAYNYGYNAGEYALSVLDSMGIVLPKIIWIDVETINTWSNDPVQNQNSIQGEYDAFAAAGVESGAYSTTVQWDDLTGSWINNWPSWGATTWTTSAGAASYCTGHEFTGGPSYLMQYTPTSTRDKDYAC
jgi:hypothetical protein